MRISSRRLAGELSARASFCIGARSRIRGYRFDASVIWGACACSESPLQCAQAFAAQAEAAAATALQRGIGVPNSPAGRGTPTQAGQRSRLPWETSPPSGGSTPRSRVGSVNGRCASARAALSWHVWYEKSNPPLLPSAATWIRLRIPYPHGPRHRAFDGSPTRATQGTPH